MELDPAYLNDLRSKCAADPEKTRVEMSPKISPRFDTKYYSYLLQRRGLFGSDAALLSDDFTRAYVVNHAEGGVAMEEAFFGDFGEAMVNMGNIQPATTQGEVRRKCSVVNYE
jgi:peroxidase